jgi:murein DD-endopeptidase MepM/ murein hydrolase activator NlpD
MSKLAYILLIILVISACICISSHIIRYIHFEYKAKNLSLIAEKNALEKEVNDLKNVKKENKESKKLIRQIVNSLVESDVGYGIGGLEPEIPPYTDNEALEVILKDIQNNNPENWQENVTKFFGEREEFVKSLPDILPLNRHDFIVITSGVGLRRSPIDNRVHTHNGIDISAKERAKVIATANGVVTGVWRNHPTFGKIIYITHSGGYKTRYAHLDEINVKYKEKVKKGQIIGIVGNTGQSQGIHLHYEIRKGYSVIDPIKFWLLY